MTPADRATGIVTTVATGTDAHALRREAAQRAELAAERLHVVHAIPQQPPPEPVAQQRERMRIRCLRCGVDPTVLAQLDAAISDGSSRWGNAMVQLVDLCIADSAFRVAIVTRGESGHLPAAFVDALQRAFGRAVVANASPDAWLSERLARPAPERLARALDPDLTAAVLGRGAAAASGWQAWRGRASIDDALGFDEIAPMLFESLRCAGVDDDEMGRIGGLRRRAAYANELLKHRTRIVVDQLAQGGIRPIVLGDLPAAVRAAEDGRVRSIRAVDLCVEPDEAARAADVLSGNGWVAHGGPLAPDRVEQHTWLRFVRDPGLVLFLHWRPLPQRCSTLVPPARDDATTRLLRLWARTGDPHPGHQLRTLCDTADVVAGSAEEIDWPRLWSDCARLDLVAYGEMYLDSLQRHGRS